MFAILHALGILVADLFKSRCRLEAENLFLRHQLAISELLTPGSSLIISDYGISDKTGKDTDFIVVTH
jgi:hypothetical protein